MTDEKHLKNPPESSIFVLAIRGHQGSFLTYRRYIKFYLYIMMYTFGLNISEWNFLIFKLSGHIWILIKIIHKV